MKPRMKSHLGISSSGIIFLIRTCNSASSCWHQPFSTNLTWQSLRGKTALFQLMARHLGFSGLCLPDWIVSYNLLIYSQSSLLRREMMPSEKEKARPSPRVKDYSNGELWDTGFRLCCFFVLAFRLHVRMAPHHKHLAPSDESKHNGDTGIWSTVKV